MSSGDAGAGTSSARVVLVTLSTGKQGSAVVRALAALNEAHAASSDTAELKYLILACTRDASSDNAKAVELGGLKGVHMLQTPYRPSEIFERADEYLVQHGRTDKKISAVFSVQQGLDNKEGGLQMEVEQGKKMADEAARRETAVDLFVYSSVDFGGINPTPCDHFESKRSIEEYIQSTHPQLPLTILRPVFFADNIADYGYSGKLFVAALNGCVKDKLQMITCKDIGIFASKAIEDPSAWKGRTLSLAGDYLSPKEMANQFKEVKGSNLPATSSLLGFGLVKSVPPLRVMFNFFNDPGFKADIEKCRSIHPTLQSWKDYVADKW